MGYPKLAAMALVAPLLSGLLSTSGLCQAYFGPPAVVTTSKLFADEEPAFLESLLGRWSGSHGYEITFERLLPSASAKGYAIAIRTSRDSSTRTMRRMALLYGPMSRAERAGQTPRAAYVLEVEPDVRGDLGGGWPAYLDQMIPTYEQWMIQVVGRQLKIDFLNVQLGEAMWGGRIWIPTLKTEKQGFAILHLEADAARKWLEVVLRARLVGDSPRVLQRM